MYICEKGGDKIKKNGCINYNYFKEILNQYVNVSRREGLSRLLYLNKRVLFIWKFLNMTLCVSLSEG